MLSGIEGVMNLAAASGENLATTSDIVTDFSVPDTGPLTDYESWMPDFIGGLAKGIEKSRGMIEQAMQGVSIYSNSFGA